MKTLLLLSIYFISWTAFCQSPNLVKVKVGDDPLKSIPVAERYRYKEFLSGFVFDQNGKPTAVSKMNFQLITGNLESISGKGDTVVMDNSDNRYLNVQVRSEYFQHTKADEYFHILMKSESVKLVSKLRWMIIRRESVENEGLRIAMSSQQQSTRRDPTTGRVILNEDLVYSKIMSFYLMDNEENVEFVGKASFADSFPEHKKEIKAFINDNQIDFDKEQDLRKLFRYCTSLK